MRCRRGTSRNDQTSFREAGEVYNCIFNITRIANSGWTYLDPDRLSRGLNCTVATSLNNLALATRIDCY